MVPPRQSELMFEALKASGGRVRLWLYQGLKHDCWTRAYNEPELPRWLLEHHLESPAESRPGAPQPPALAERLLIPLHPPALKLATEQLDNLAGVYCDAKGNPAFTVFRQGDQLYAKNRQGEIAALGAESATQFFYLNGSSTTRLRFERNAEGHATALVLSDDRHEERWERRKSSF
jgi:hypothetical protein